MSIAPDNLVAYDVEVDDPRHIPDLVKITQELGAYTPVLIGLDHQEDCSDRHAMRGRYEDFGGLEPGEDVFRRPDGGKTVYTDDSKYALTFGSPLEPGDQKRAESYTQALHDFIDERTHITFQRGKRDLYLGGDQIIGVSQLFGPDSAVRRAYWAEEVPDIYDIMYRDGASKEEIRTHREAMEKSAEVLGEQNFYNQVMKELRADTVNSTEFLETHVDKPGEEAERLLKEEGRREHGVCFLTRPEE